MELSTIAVRQISQIPEDQLILRAVWGPSPQQRYFTHAVRGVPVQVTTLTQLSDRNISYRLCVFPDGREQWVNEGNIRSKKVKRTIGEVDESGTKA